MADEARVKRLAEAPNVKVIRQRKTGTIVEVQVLEAGDDSRLESYGGNSCVLHTRFENPDNPPNVWALKRSLEFAAAGKNAASNCRSRPIGLDPYILART